MLLNNHNEDTEIDDCLLIISEDAVRFLWLLKENEKHTDEFLWLLNELDFHNGSIADMHILGLIEVGIGISLNELTLDDWVIEPRGKELLEYAISQGVVMDDLKIDIQKS